MHVGQHVWCKEPFGWGRIARLDEDGVDVDFFESPARPRAHTARYRLGEVVRGALPKQTRVYWEQEGHWRAGRVVGGDPVSGYAVRPPNEPYDLLMGAEHLQVRWSQPVADPLEVLLAGANESPHFAATRLPFLSGVVAQRAATSSVPAVLSSAVELYPHQLETVLQVLHDPIQRYLLADEVGLGKTIEAGMLLRQYLLSEPEGAAMVLAPDALRRQWQEELRQRFFIDDFPHAALRIVSHEAPERWSGITAPGLLIVDEAHRLVCSTGSPEHLRSLRALCHGAPRLLLLSATPALNNEGAFLQLLNLLDPEIYDVADVEGFTARVRARHRIAQAFYALDPDFPETVPLHLAAVREAFADDERLAGLVEQVEDAAWDESPGLPERIEDLRRYVNETYRLHRRVIRHRRARVLTGATCGPDSPEFEVTGRGAPHVLAVADPVVDEAESALEEWRVDVSEHLVGYRSTGDGNTAFDVLSGEQASEGAAPEVAAYARVHDLLLTNLRDPQRLRHLLQARLSGSGRSSPVGAAPRRSSGRAPAGTSTRPPQPTLEEAQAMAAAPVLPADHRLLQRLSSTPGTPSAQYAEHAAHLARLLRPVCARHRKVVVFGESPHLGAALAEALRHNLAGAEVSTHLSTEPAEAREAALGQWVSGQARVLVCDASAEEGRNLQAADALVHLDLPTSVNRLEQRIGRVDRYGEQGPAVHHVMLPQAMDSLYRAWFEVLRDGFELWRGSLSSLQYAIESLAPQVARTSLLHGADGLLEHIDDVRSTLTERAKEIAAEDELEASFHTARGHREIFESIDGIETSWQGFERVVEDLAFRAEGSLQLQSVPATDRSTRTFRPGPRILVPELQVLTAAPGSWDTPGSFNRTAALRRRGHRVLRYGSPLVDTLAAWVHEDDRGQASAWWRVHPRLAEEQVYLAFDYLVEGDLDSIEDSGFGSHGGPPGAPSPASPVLSSSTMSPHAAVEASTGERAAGSAEARRALRRRLDGWLAPFMHRVWLEAFSHQPPEAAVQTTLQRRYDPRHGDVNLNASRLPALHDLFGGQRAFATAVRRAHVQAPARLRVERDVDALIERAAARASADMRDELATLQARGRAGLEHRSGALTEQLSQALLRACQHPRARLLAVSCVVLSGRRLPVEVPAAHAR
ncbi:protein DpdE [Kineococcus sp. SYSU DK005]|uniref:protein DpdE n=1 Tax=Kineococcus sp. SYSU DK005 TaxID=3383126 RepID=UPI003D7E569E